MLCPILPQLGSTLSKMSGRFCNEGRFLSKSFVTSFMAFGA